MSKLSDIRLRIIRNVESEARRTGQRIFDALQQKLSQHGEPRPNEPPHQITGEYKSSFTLEHRAEGARFVEEISTDHPAALPLEFGTSKTEPHGHLRSTLREVASKS